MFPITCYFLHTKKSPLLVKIERVIFYLLFLWLCRRGGRWVTPLSRGTCRCSPPTTPPARPTDQVKIMCYYFINFFPFKVKKPLWIPYNYNKKFNKKQKILNCKIKFGTTLTVQFTVKKSTHLDGSVCVDDPEPFLASLLLPDYTPGLCRGRVLRALLILLLKEH